MLSSVLIGGLSKVVNNFFEFRQQKMLANIEEQKKDKALQRQIEIMSAQAEYNLKIEQEKTTQAELGVLAQRIHQQEVAIKEIGKTDRTIFRRLRDDYSWVLALTAIMKPSITAVSLFLFTYITVGVVNRWIDNSTLQILQELGIMLTIESVIGFWFGIASIEKVSKK